jgi:hypothetical protein
MQPKPIAETKGPFFPNFLFMIVCFNSRQSSSEVLVKKVAETGVIVAKMRMMAEFR